MSKEFALPKKIFRLNCLNNRSIDTQQRVYATIETAVSNFNFKTPKLKGQKNTSKKTKSQSNTNGRLTEEFIIGLVADICKMFPHLSYNTGLQCHPDVSNLDKIRKNYHKPDLILNNSISNNELHFEMKCMEKKSELNYLYLAKSSEYVAMKKHLLIVVNGSVCTPEFIQRENNLLAANNQADYIFMIHHSHLKSFIQYWSNSIKTDFESFSKIIKNS